MDLLQIRVTPREILAISRRVRALRRRHFKSEPHRCTQSAYLRALISTAAGDEKIVAAIRASPVRRGPKSTKKVAR